MTHGGKRANAGRPKAEIDKTRVINLVALGMKSGEIARRIGLHRTTVSRFLLKLKAL